MSMPYDALDAEREKRMAAHQRKDPSTFYFKCPLCDWRSKDYDPSYWPKRWHLDDLQRYKAHYTTEHHPIPLPEFIKNQDD